MEKRQLDTFLAALTEAEQLLHSPTVPQHVQKPTKLILQIARKAPTAAIRSLAMKAVSEADALRTNPRDRTKLDNVLWQLRLALQDETRGPDTPT